MKIIKTIKRALILSAPFLLMTVSIILLSYGVFNLVMSSSVYVRMFMGTGVATGDNQTYLQLDDLTKKKLEENNEGMRISSEFPAIAIGEQWATLTIESAQVYDQPVVHGESVELLDRSIGHSPNSRFPGQNGRIVIPGHVAVTRFFRYLTDCKPGDLVELDTIYGKYVYKVVDMVIFGQHDYSWVIPLEEETEDQLICYTCYPYVSAGVRTERFAIICEKVSGDSWVNEDYEEGKRESD